MSDIQYAAVLEGTQIVAEIGAGASVGVRRIPARDVATSIAAQAQAQDVACVTTNQVTAYYIKTQRTVVALARDGAPPRVLIGFLREVDTQLRASENATTAAYQSVLESVKTRIDADRNSLAAARHEMDQVKQVMVENIDRLLERGERVSLLVDRTGAMSESANLFNRQATQLKRKMWFQNVKLLAVVAGLVGAATFGAVELL